MSFDLVAIGGTGQCVLLELLFRRERNAETPLPANVWVVDPDDGQGGQVDHLAGRLAEAARAAGITLSWVWPLRAGAALKDVVGNPARLPHGAREYFSAALTDIEMEQVAAKGFYAMPRIAGAWVGLCGFDPGLPFAAPNLTAAPGRLVMVGSLAGGTGAGLLPSLISAVRQSAPESWKQELLVLPVLPWFNPSLCGGPAWEDTLWNAHDGLLELDRLTDSLNRRVTASGVLSASVAPTFVSVVGADGDATTTAPPQIDEAWRARSFGGELAEIVDLVVDLVSHKRKAEVNADPMRALVGFGELPERRAGGYAGGGVRNRFVAEQVLVLRDSIRYVRENNRFLIGSHLGRFVDAIIKATTQPGSSQDFWDHFDGALAERARTLGELSGAGGVAAAFDVVETGKVIDRGCGARRKEATDLANSIAVRDAGVQVAGMIVNCLLAAEEKRAVEVLRSSPSTVPLMSAGLRNALLTDTKYQPRAVEGLSSFKYHGPEAVKVLAAALRPTGAAFHGSSWARLLGHAHKYDNIARIDASRDQGHPLGEALLLWKAALLGLLQFRDYTMTDPDRHQMSWYRAEDFAHDVGPRLTTLWYEDQCVGIATAKNGLLPSAELVDDKGRKLNQQKRETPVWIAHDNLVQAVRRHESDASLLPQLLEAFAQVAAGGRRPVASWAQVIWPTTTGIGGASPTQLLNQHTLPASRISLSTDAEVRELRLPLLVKNKDLVRSVVCNRAASRILEVDSAGALTLSKPNPANLGTVEIDGNRRYLLTLDTAGWQAAGRRVTSQSDGEPWAQIDW